MIDPARAATVVTAAGFSSRMGALKPLLDWNGVPLIRHQVDCLHAFGQVIVVVGHEAERVMQAIPARENVRVVIHPGYAEGRASSLRAGFQALVGDPEAVLVVGVDQPIDPVALDVLWAGMTPETEVALPVAAARRGHPVIFGGRLLPELREVNEPEQGLRGVVKRHRVQEVRVPGSHWNLNRPEAYALARMGQLEALFLRLNDYPVHTTRRSATQFARTLREALLRHPGDFVAGEDLFLVALRMEAQGNAWLHLGARSHDVLFRDLNAAWERLSSNLEGFHVEAWLGDEIQVEAFEALGFRLARRMHRYRLDQATSHPPHPGLRPRRDEDFPALMELQRLTNEDAEPLTEQAYREVLETYHHTEVLEADGRVLGCFHAKCSGELGLLEGLAVHPDAQGRGHGRALLERALTWLVARGAKSVELLVLSEATPARTLYERMGFRSVGEHYWVERPVRVATTTA